MSHLLPNNGQSRVGSVPLWSMFKICQHLYFEGYRVEIYFIMHASNDIDLILEMLMVLLQARSNYNRRVEAMSAIVQACDLGYLRV
jgi:hypothetical protein